MPARRCPKRRIDRTAVSAAVARGRCDENVVLATSIAAIQREGNRPTTIILVEELTPKSLGTLIALYEHLVFTQAVIWDIDPFDQWGVELGKQLAERILPELRRDGEQEPAHDSSTTALIRRYRRSREERGG